MKRYVRIIGILIALITLFGCNRTEQKESRKVNNPNPNEVNQSGNYVAFTDQYIYYVGENCWIYEFDNAKKVSVPIVKGEKEKKRLFVYDNVLYFQTRYGHQEFGLAKYDLQTNQYKKITSKSDIIRDYDDRLYLSQNCLLFRKGFEGKLSFWEGDDIAQNEPKENELFIYDNYVYYFENMYDERDNKLTQLNLESLTSRIIKLPGSFETVDKNMIYVKKNNLLFVQYNMDTEETKEFIKVDDNYNYASGLVFTENHAVSLFKNTLKQDSSNDLWEINQYDKEGNLIKTLFKTDDPLIQPASSPLYIHDGNIYFVINDYNKSTEELKHIQSTLEKAGMEHIVAGIYKLNL